MANKILATLTLLISDRLILLRASKTTDLRCEV
jgi:hypothetical protein